MQTATSTASTSHTTTTTTSSTTSSSTVRRINPEGVVPIEGIHHVVVVPPGSTVHVGGQVALDGRGEPVSDDFVTQVRHAARNLVACLGAAGATPADLVRVRAFVVGLDPHRLAQFEETVIGELPGWSGPTATLVGVESLFLPGLLVEIDAEAVAADA